MTKKYSGYVSALKGKILVSALVFLTAGFFVLPEQALAVGGSFTTNQTVANVTAGTNDQTAVTATTVANVTEVKASRTLTVGAIPANNETITIGTCVVTFKNSVADELDCTDNAAKVERNTASETASTIAASLRLLTNVLDTNHGALTVGGSAATASFTTSGTETSATAVAFTDGTSGDVSSTSSTTGVVAVAQKNTITIGGTVEAGDTFTANLPGAVTASYVSTSADASTTNIASNLNTAIQTSSGYASQAFTSAVAANVITLTAKTAGTGFTQTSGTSNRSAVAQVVTFTPSGIQIGETYRGTINSSNYDYKVLNGNNIDTVVSNLAPAMDGNAAVGCSEDNTKVTCTATVAGTAFTYAASVIPAATFTLTYTPGANGSITGSSSQTVNDGADGSAVTAVANGGYHFVDWSDASTSNPRTDTNVVGNISVTANFAANPVATHTLTYTAGANGSITGTTPQTVNDGANGTAVTAVANGGYHFVDWSDASTANPRTDTSVVGDISVTANFAANPVVTHTLTYTAGANGSITGTSPQTVNDGANGAAVTAVADSGYHFVNWSDASTSNPRTDTGVTGDISVTANFAANPVVTHTLTYTAGANGSITGVSPQTVNDGANGSAVTAVADSGYHFVNWSDTSTNNPRTDTSVTGDITVTANFAVNPVVTHALTYTAGANGSITGTSPQTVNDGANGTAVTAVANGGFHFVDWSDSSTANPRTDTGVTGDISVTANFATNPVVTHTLTYTAGANGSITGTSPQTVNDGANGTAVTAVADANYHFVNWSDASTSNPRTDLSVTGDITVTANFVIDTHTLTYNAGSNGSISGSTSQVVNHGSNGTSVTAVPDSGYHFVDWSDSSTSNPRTDTSVTGDVTVTANFAANPPGTHNLTYIAGSNGSISGTATQTVADATDGTVVTAVADSGYHFVNWSDASTSNPRTDTNVTGDISVTANFAANPVVTTHTISVTVDSHGAVSPNGSVIVNDGDNQTFTITVDSGFAIFRVSVDGVNVGSVDTYTFLNVTANHTLSAEFVPTGGGGNGIGGGGGGGGGTAPAAPATPSTPTTPTTPVTPSTPQGQVLGTATIANGTLVKDGTTIYLIYKGNKRPFASAEEFLSYGFKFKDVIVDSSISEVTEGNVIRAMDGTLALDHGTIYLIGLGGVKRGFASAKVFNGLGYKFGQARKINLSGYAEGPVIDSAEAAHPDGALIIDKGTVWWIKNGFRHGFTSLGVFKSYGLSFNLIVKGNAADQALPVGDLVLSRDTAFAQD